MSFRHAEGAHRVELGDALRGPFGGSRRNRRVLGIDDVDLRRKKHPYGTLHIDLALHRAVDLLDDRTAEMFAKLAPASPRRGDHRARSRRGLCRRWSARCARDLRQRQ